MNLNRFDYQIIEWKKILNIRKKWRIFTYFFFVWVSLLFFPFFYKVYSLWNCFSINTCAPPDIIISEQNFWYIDWCQTMQKCIKMLSKSCINFSLLVVHQVKNMNISVAYGIHLINEYVCRLGPFQLIALKWNSFHCMRILSSLRTCAHMWYKIIRRWLRIISYSIQKKNKYLKMNFNFWDFHHVEGILSGWRNDFKIIIWYILLVGTSLFVVIFYWGV